MWKTRFLCLRKLSILLAATVIAGFLGMGSAPWVYANTAEHTEHGSHSESISSDTHEDEEHDSHAKSASSDMHAEESHHEKHKSSLNKEKGVSLEHGSSGITNVIHWVILFALAVVIYNNLRNMGNSDEEPKFIGALVSLVIFMFIYEQIPEVAHFHDHPDCFGIAKFSLKMLIGIFLTFIGIKGMHGHHEGHDGGHH